MIDLEGMNKLPQAHLTRILQVAAAPFDEFGALTDVPHFNMFANRAYPKHTVDNPETVVWWKSRPIWSQMVSHQDRYGVPLVELMIRLNAYIDNIERQHGQVTIWACHPEYDLTAIYASMVECGIKPSWNFYQVKDYATVRDQYKGALSLADATHWAHEDVIRQINTLLQCKHLGWSL